MILNFWSGHDGQPNGVLKGRDVLTGLCQVDGVGGDDYEEDHDLQKLRGLLP